MVLVVTGDGRVAGTELAVVLVRCPQVRRRQLVELFALGRCGGRLGRELFAQDLLVRGLVLVVLGRLLLAGLPRCQRGTSGCCIHLAGLCGLVFSGFDESSQFEERESVAVVFVASRFLSC